MALVDVDALRLDNVLDVEGRDEARQLGVALDEGGAQRAGEAPSDLALPSMSMPRPIVRSVVEGVSGRTRDGEELFSVFDGPER